MRIIVALLVVVAGCVMEEKKELGLENLSKATFAGGCFWCMESAFELVEGVAQVVSGFTGGKVENPSYKEVSKGSTGHVEAVVVYFDPAKVGYDKLLEVFWRQIDPTDENGQFADRGQQYTTAIFYHDEEQRNLAEKSKQNLEKSGKFENPIATKILPSKEFYEAEEYHQDYYKKNPIRYKVYRAGSGRDAFIKETWGDTK